MPEVGKGSPTLLETRVRVGNGETPFFNGTPEKFRISGQAIDGGVGGEKCQALGPFLGSS